jgi:NADH-quinone oxidoreductase subunit J
MADIVILAIMVWAGFWAVMTRSILRAAIALAAASALVAVLMFRLNSPLAAVFELSVCSGLISVLFISTISLASSETTHQKAQHARERGRRFWLLPVVLALAGMVLMYLQPRLSVSLPPPEKAWFDARHMLWNGRPFDMVGQIIILLAGVFGVVILFKESQEE